MEFDYTRKLQSVGIVLVAAVTALNYLAHSPVIWFASVIGLLGCIYSILKLREQFDVPLFFVRTDGVNYWSGGLGGLIGGVCGLYGATRNFKELSFIEFGTEVSLITIYLTLGVILMTGTILQDIEDGYIEIER